MINTDFYVFRHRNNASMISTNISFQTAEIGVDFPILKIIPDRAKTLTLFTNENFQLRIRASATFTGDGTKRTFDLNPSYRIVSSPDFDRKTTYGENDGVAWVRVNHIFTKAFRIHYDTNKIEFHTAPPSGQPIRVDYLFRAPPPRTYATKLFYTFKNPENILTSIPIIESQVETLNTMAWTSPHRYRYLESLFNNKLGEAMGIPLSKQNEGTLDLCVNVPIKTTDCFVTGELLDLTLGVLSD